MKFHHATIQDQIIYHEGIRLKPYQCTAGKLTIGIGRNLDDAGISKPEALMMLKNDIESVTDDLMFLFGRMVFDKFTEGRKRALIDLRFNIGGARFRDFQKMIHAIRVGDWQEAAEQLKASLWWNQVQDNRRDTLYAQIKTGEP